MNLLRIQDVMHGAPVIPVLVVRDLQVAQPLAEALLEGGLPYLEVTLRSDCALAAIEAMAQLPGVVVGAGTVRSAADLLASAQAGAAFAVSPGLPPALLEAPRPIPLLPGVMTPTEVMRASDAGFRALKLFPARAAGGVDALKAFAGPLPDVEFCPTGGVGEDDMARYLALPNVPCVGGSWLAPDDLIARRDWAAITERARRAVAIACGRPAQASHPADPLAGDGGEDPGSALEELR